MSKILSKKIIRNILFLATIIVAVLSLGSGPGTDGFIDGITGTTITKAARPPSVATLDANDIIESSATLRGNLKSLGTASSVKVSFEYGVTTRYGNSTAEQTMTRRGRFYIDLTNLTAGTTYHFRAKAVGDGTTYGDDRSFTISASAPVVATMAASNITSAGATLEGKLTDTGSDRSVTVAFEYGTTTRYGKSVTGEPSTLSSGGTFTANLTGLIPGQTYHFRAKAVGDGTDYGNDQSFTTSTSAPVVATGAASNITSTGAMLKGNLTSTGGVRSVTVAFEYGTTAIYSKKVAGEPSTLTSDGTFTANLTGLIPGTTYHVRAKATGDGTSYGKETIFTTPQLPATFTLTTFDITPQTSQVGDMVNISVTCTNIGGSPDMYTVVIKINGLIEYIEEISLDPGESQLVTYDNTESNTGNYIVDVNGLSGSFVVKESLGSTQKSSGATSDYDWLLIAGIAGGTIVAGLIVLFIFRRSMV